MRRSLPLLALGMLALPGCPDHNPGPDAASSNPATLWLSPVGSDERQVQLVAAQPPPF